MTNESDSVQSLPVVMADEQKRTREAERRNFILLLCLNEGFAGFYSAVHLFFPTILFGLAFTIINQDKIGTIGKRVLFIQVAPIYKHKTTLGLVNRNV